MTSTEPLIQFMVEKELTKAQGELAVESRSQHLELKRIDDSVVPMDVIKLAVRRRMAGCSSRCNL